ncbi:MAG: ATP-binding cassette domain-containing protein [Prevotella sp.]|nr:ATP-binding cassette domain-containing protein [Prevotella sp.]
MQRIVTIHDGIALNPDWCLARPVHFEMMDNEHIAILGPNGSGKTLLADMIAGRHPLRGNNPVYDFSSLTTDDDRSSLASDNIAYVTFRDAYGGETDRTYYLQQRWNQTEMDAEIPSVLQSIQRDAHLSGLQIPTDGPQAHQLYDLLGLTPLLEKSVVMLSSGELRKLQLAKALLRRPHLLIIDNPFIGLDAASRDLLVDHLTYLASDQSLRIILVLTRKQDIPAFITHVVEVNDGCVGPSRPLQRTDSEPLAKSSPEVIVNNPTPSSSSSSPEVLHFNDVTIRYGTKTIISHLSWTVREGEHWAIYGPNGSGKSTLLSLVCADNPQAYACDISLFGHRRGSGESIWDIKRRIGYVSPEMHRSYYRNIPVIQVIASGLTDSIGFYRPLTDDQQEQCHRVMRFFRVDEFANRSFTTLSNGEQRLVLLARAFVKDPVLLILDEPFHGLDDANCAHVKTIIEDYCRQPGKTLLMVSHYRDDLPPAVTHWLQM